MPLSAHWLHRPNEMFWEYLGFCSSGLIASYSDFKEMLHIFSHCAGTSCAVVAESIYEGRAKKGGCGARHVCFVCQHSEDKSLTEDRRFFRQPSSAIKGRATKRDRRLIDKSS